jgi:hypothetical protein
MSTAKPMKPVRRAMAYMEQNGGANSMGLAPYTEPRRMTPAQRRRIKHKNHKMLGAAGGGTVKPRQVKTRQVRPAPTPGGLLRLLSPKQVRQRVAARSARTGIRFKVSTPAGQTMIIDDPIRMGNGDR